MNCLQGVAIEVLQYWSGFRFGDWEDAVADAVGVVLGLLVARVFGKVLGKVMGQGSIDPYQN